MRPLKRLEELQARLEEELKEGNKGGFKKGLMAFFQKTENALSPSATFWALRWD